MSSIATSSNLLFGEGIPRVSTLKKILKPPQPEVAKPPNYPRNYGKVLTSAENLKIIQDKERLKSEMLAEKERKRQERERKKEERLEEAKRKKEERERKKKEKEMAQMRKNNEQVAEDIDFGKHYTFESFE